MLVSTALIPPAATEPPPPPLPRPETIRGVVDAVGALESMGDAAFEKLLAGYRDVEAAKGTTFAYTWMMFTLERHTGLTATRAMAAAGVLGVHRARQAEAEATVSNLLGRYMAHVGACEGSVFHPRDHRSRVEFTEAELAMLDEALARYDELHREAS